MKKDKITLIVSLLAALFYITTQRKEVIYLPCPDKEEGKTILCGSVCGLKVNYMTKPSRHRD